MGLEGNMRFLWNKERTFPMYLSYNLNLISEGNVFSEVVISYTATATLPMVGLCVTDQWHVRVFRKAVLKDLQFQSAILVVQEWLFSPIYVVII